MPWKAENGIETKTLVDRGVGPLLLRALRLRPDAELGGNTPLPFYAALVVDGEVVIGSEKLGAWDFMRVTGRGARATVRFPRGATLLAASLR